MENPTVTLRVIYLFNHTQEYVTGIGLGPLNIEIFQPFLSSSLFSEGLEVITMVNFWQVQCLKK